MPTASPELAPCCGTGQWAFSKIRVLAKEPVRWPRPSARVTGTQGGVDVHGGLDARLHGEAVGARDGLALEQGIDHVSSGGGATLELIEKGDLPGLAALRAGVSAALR